MNLCKINFRGVNKSVRYINIWSQELKVKEVQSLEITLAHDWQEERREQDEKKRERSLRNAAVEEFPL